jgi:hypothetical protein
MDILIKKMIETIGVREFFLALCRITLNYCLICIVLFYSNPTII